MSMFSKGADHDGSVKSLSLEEILAERPSRWSRIVGFARFGLMLWGGLSFAAATGTAAYYLHRPSDGPVLVSETKPAPVLVAAATAMPDAEILQAGTFSPPPNSVPIVEARLPRPRPDEPVFTGSVGQPGTRVVYTPFPRERYVDPCEAFRRMGAPFRLRIRCGEEARYTYAPAPPPPRAYYPPRY